MMYVFTCDNLSSPTVSPSITDFVVSDSDPAVGDDILLECCVDGTPLPDVEWWKDEKRISPNERISISTKNDFMFVLTINDTTAEDGGVYTCLASNIAGETEEENTITVERTYTVCVYVTTCYTHFD